MVGINETGTANLTSINEIANSTTIEQFAILVDQNIYGGIFWFVMLWVLWIIIFSIAQQAHNRPLQNMLSASVVCTLISFILRAITVLVDGVSKGMLSDYHMWVFPLFTSMLGAAIWAIKDR